MSIAELLVIRQHVIWMLMRPTAAVCFAVSEDVEKLIAYIEAARAHEGTEVLDVGPEVGQP